MPQTEKADEGRHRPDGCQKEQPAFEVEHLAADRDLHDLVDPLFEADEGACHRFLRAAPFAHRRDEERGEWMLRAVAHFLIEIVQRAPGPEDPLELVGTTLDPREPPPLVENDGP